MTGKPQIDYQVLAQDAMRGMVRTVLMRAATSGLPGEHHFYIAFDTRTPGVMISRRLKEKYPEEMTIVLQHQFWQLTVNDERFEVTLSFDNVPERLTVPLRAVRVFFDPSVPYGLQFEGSDLAGEAVGELEVEGAESAQVDRRAGALSHPTADAAAEPRASRKVEKVRSPRKPRTPKGDAASEAPGPDGGQRRQPALPKLAGSKPDQPANPANDAKVVELDKFRKR